MVLWSCSRERCWEEHFQIEPALWGAAGPCLSSLDEGGALHRALLGPRCPGSFAGAGGCLQIRNGLSGLWLISFKLRPGRGVVVVVVVVWWTLRQRQP